MSKEGGTWKDGSEEGREEKDARGEGMGGKGREARM